MDQSSVRDKSRDYPSARGMRSIVIDIEDGMLHTTSFVLILPHLVLVALISLCNHLMLKWNDRQTGTLSEFPIDIPMAFCVVPGCFSSQLFICTQQVLTLHHELPPCQSVELALRSTERCPHFAPHEYIQAVPAQRKTTIIRIHLN